jgi:citrate lyase beta subunit
MEDPQYTPRQKEIVWANQLIAKLSAARFYGELVIEMKDGRIVMVTEKKTTKPPQF